MKLDANNNYDIEGKRLANVGQGVEVHDATNMSQLTQLRAHSLQVDGSSHMTGDLDIRGNKIILPGEINMNRKLIKNLDVDENDDLSAVNMVTLEKFSSSSGDIDLQEKYNVKNSKQQSFAHLAANYDNLVSFNDVKNIFLSRKETFPMEAGLDMGNQTIFNVKDPTVADHGVNKGYVDNSISSFAANPTLGETNLSGKKIINLGNPTTKSNATNKKYVDNEIKKHRDLAIQEGLQIPAEIDQKADKTWVNSTFYKTGTQLDMGGEKITNLRTPTSNTDAATKTFVDDEVGKTIDSHSLKNELAYLMEDVDESSSENNIIVDGIEDLEKSPHKHNKKAHDLKLKKKNSNNNYVSRLGFNMFELPGGEYTICVEFFPVKMTNVSVNAVSSSFNVGQQTTTLFTQEGYARSIIHMHKWQISPPEYLILGLRFDVETPSPQAQAYLIIYGIKGNYSDVPPKVFDQPFVFESGKMVMETDLDLNGKRLLHFPKSKAVIFGNYKKATGGQKATFTINNETAHHVFGFSLTVKKITLHFTVRDGPIVSENTSVMIKVSPNRTQSASGVYIGSNAISYSFDFAVAANEEFELSLRNRGGIARANVTMLIEI